jgi:lysophospholipid acyltransferase (LPLAT)-like uncharacterized protein
VAGGAASLSRRLGRAVAGSRAATGAAAALISGYIWLVARTTRWTVVGGADWRALTAGPGGAVCATWHGRLFMAPALAPRGKPAVAMISGSRDGDLMAAVIGRWGVRTVRGSSHDRVRRRAKGGAAAFRSAARALRDEGALVAITPDGPRGPRMQAQDGAARLALMRGAPVIAVGYSVRWGWHLSSWDRFLLPLPFGRGAIVHSAPRLPPRDRGGEALARFRLALESDLNAVTDRADDLCGRARVLPCDAGRV